MDTYTADAFTVLADGAAASTGNGIGQVASANKILDLGGIPTRTDVGIIGSYAVTRFAVIIDVDACVTTDTDNTYRIGIMGSNVSDGTKPVSLGGVHLGNGTNIPNGTAASAATGAGSTTVAPCKIIIFATNEQADIKYRYIYLYNTIAGTSKSITYRARLGMWPGE